MSTRYLLFLSVLSFSLCLMPVTIWAESPENPKKSGTSPATITAPKPLAAPTVQKPNATSAPKKPEIGAISRSTGHLFREGLASGIAADRAGEKTAPLTTNDHGLLSTKKQGSLGADLWNNTDSKVFGDMIEKLAPNTHIPLMNPLARRLLLTESPWPKGPEFQALRLEKIIDFGAYTESSKLYHFLAPDSSNLRLVRAGVQALYRTGERATACLEMNANPAVAVPGNDFWDNTKKACTSFKFDESDVKWAKFDPITPLLSPLPSDIRDDVILLYAEQSANPAQNAEKRAQKLLSLFEKLPWSVRSLFAPTFLALPPSFSASPDQLPLILGALLAANAPESSLWVKRLRATLPTPLSHDDRAAALLFTAQMQGFDAPKNPIPFQFNGDHTAQTHHLGKLFIKYTELLDTAPNFIDNPSVTYEKRRGLTQADHYVMPVDVLRSNLAKGRENRARGLVLLTILLTLQSDKIGDIDPDLFSDIISYLMSAGLNEEARQTATYVFLGALR